MYNFDFEKMLKWLIPYQIRKPKLLAFFRGLLSHLERIYNQFLQKVAEANERIRITGQVRILRYELNKRFDPTQKRIEVLDAEIEPVLWIFIEAENQPVYLPNFVSGAGYDFVVKIPIEYQIQEAFIKEFLDTYKLDGKRYQLNYVI